MSLAAPYFSSHCPPCRESCVKAPFQMLFISKIGSLFRPLDTYDSRNECGAVEVIE